MNTNPAQPPRIARQAISVDATQILRRLDRAGHSGYLVGGCVRDLLLGITPKDFDLATSARPRQVKRLFRYSRIIGRRFKLVHVRMGQHIYEVATFRAPPEPEEGGELYIRRDNVFGTEKQDAFRRDFTINGIFYDPLRERIVDHVGGLDDLRERRIRTIGDPDVRLREDPVRILRAARFAARLDLEIDPDLKEAIGRHAGDLERAAPPRVLEELYRLVSGRGSSRAFRLLADLGALAVLLPELGSPDDSFYEALDRLTRRTQGSRDGVRQSLLAAVLFSPPALTALADCPPYESEPVAAEALRPIARRFTVARRDFSFAAQFLAAQPRLREAPRGRGAARFVRRECFPDALNLFEILNPPDPQTDDLLRRWRDLASEHRQDTAPGRRRRRRGRRRPRGRDSSSDAARG